MFTTPIPRLFLLATVVFLIPSCVAKPVRTLCVMPIDDVPGPACHASFATKYYQRNFSAIDWAFRFVTDSELNKGPTSKNFVRSWVLRGDGHCDLLVGPGTSRLAAAMSPLIEVPWMDFAASATELSDKKEHPFFSRAIPTDEVGAASIGVAFKHFGWKSTNILCSEGPYGRSVMAGISKALFNNDGFVDQARCIKQTASEETVREALDVFLASKTKLVFVAASPRDEWFTHLKKIIVELDLSKKLVFAFPDSYCSFHNRKYSAIDGALCATYTQQESIIQPFVDAMRSEDRSDELNAMRALGYDATALNRCQNSSFLFASLAHDAALHGMSAITKYEEELALGKTEADLGTRIEFMRNHTTKGATGTMALTMNGDRSSVDLKIYHSIQDTEKVIGYVRDTRFEFHNPTNPGTMPVMSFFGQLQTTMPSVAVPDPELFDIDEESAINVGVLMAIIIPLLIVVIVVISLTMKLLAPKTRNNNAAPKDHGKPFTIVFTDIQSSTALWARVPETMSEAVEIHHSAIRSLIKKHNGYEVKTIGDSFMVAFQHRSDAVHFGLEIQSVFFNESWPGNGELDASYKDLMNEKGDIVPPNYEALWNGIRVRVGIHHGSGTIQEDPVTLGFDYYGTVVNTAARVEGVGHGGQVLVTDSVLKDLKLPADIITVDLGPQILRGLDTPVHLFQLCDGTIGCAKRTFPTLRLERDVDTDRNESGDDMTHSIDGSESQTSISGAIHAKAGKYAAKGASPAEHTRNVEELVYFHRFAKMMFSTANSEFRCKSVSHLANKWRIAGVSDKTLKKSVREYESGMLDLVAKTLQATNMKYKDHNDQQALPDANNSHTSTEKMSITTVGSFKAMPQLPGQPSL